MELLKKVFTGLANLERNVDQVEQLRTRVREVKKEKDFQDTKSERAIGTMGTGPQRPEDEEV